MNSPAQSLAVPASTRSLRVSIVTETYLPEVNGVAMTMGRLVDGLLARGHRVQLIRPRQHDDDHPRSEGRLDILPLPGFQIPFYPQLRMGWSASRRLTKSWQQALPDIVHIVTEGPLGGSALSAARRLGLRIFSGFHTNFHRYSRHYGAGLLAQPIVAYLRYFHNRTHCTLVPTDELATELQNAGFQKLRVLARGVDTQLFKPERRDVALRQQWGVDGDDPVALFVGRLAAEKNLQLALDAYQSMRSIQPKARLVLVGDGPMLPGLRQQYPEVIFADMRIGADLATHYASADVFLFPSLTETFGNVTLEAMASGLAVVAFDYAAAHRHITDGQNGLRIAFNDSTAFIAAACRLADDPGLVYRLRQAARQAVLPFDWERICHRLEQWYLEPSHGKHSP